MIALATRRQREATPARSLADGERERRRSTRARSPAMRSHASMRDATRRAQRSATLHRAPAVSSKEMRPRWIAVTSNDVASGDAVTGTVVAIPSSSTARSSRGRWARRHALALAAALSSSGCVLSTIDLSNRSCPCAPGWSCGPDDVCVEGDLDAGIGPDGSVTGGLVAWYPFDDLADGVVTDATGRGHEGACPAGCPEPTTGPLGVAAQFDGSGRYVRVPYTPDFRTEAGFTIAVWFRFDGTESGAMVSKPYGPATNTWLLFVLRTPASTFDVAFETPPSATLSAPAPVIGTWHHLAGSWDGTTKRLYLDGAMVGELPTSVAFDLDDVLIGADLDADVVIPFVGALDDVRIYDRALSTDELVLLATRP
jgi:hypothetical protein